MVDWYTKAVLTVIAAALVALALRDIVGSLGAQGREIQRVQICDSYGLHCRWPARLFSVAKCLNWLALRIYVIGKLRVFHVIGKFYVCPRDA
jgi:hypothetical protein